MIDYKLPKTFTKISEAEQSRVIGIIPAQHLISRRRELVADRAARIKCVGAWQSHTLQKKVPAIDHIDALELKDKDGAVEVIENRPGKAGSVAVYNALLQEFGVLDSNAAKRGLELYAEHTEDARTNPGKHPNIDRLFTVIDSGDEQQIRIVSA